MEPQPIAFRTQSFAERGKQRARVGAIKRGRGKAADTQGRQPPSAVATRQRTRESARLVAASDALALAFPAGEGNAAHYLLTDYFDPCDLLLAVLARLAVPCLHLRIATLSLSTTRNLPMLVAALEPTGTVRRLDLLLSRYSADVDPQIALECRAALSTRWCKVEARRVYCKFCLLHMADGAKFTLHGSANLRSCRCTEQVSLCRCAATHDFFAAWFDREVSGEPNAR